MIRPAPTRRAAWIVLSPTPPQPQTATLAPGGTRARLNDGPGAGEHAAAHEAHDVERRVLPHGDDALLGEHGVGGVPETWRKW